MALVALLGDLHIGQRDDDMWVQAYQKKFFQFMVDELEERGVTQILQLGDWFDVRRGATQETLMFQRTFFNDLLKPYDTHVLVGNHDMHMREHIVPNTPYEVLSLLPNMTIYEKPTTVDFGGVKIDIIPWICKENSKEIGEFIDASTSEYCVGHFELNGYLFARGQKSTGIDAGFLKKYKQVWSGHFHTQSEAGNVQYLGTPYTLTLADADDKRGFFLFDTETHELEFVENPDCWHTKLYYDANTFDPATIPSYADKNVKIIVNRRSSDSNNISFDVVEERIASIAHACQTLDELDIIADVADGVKDIKDIDDYVGEYADTLEESTDVKEQVKAIFSSLRAEALENS